MKEKKDITDGRVREGYTVDGIDTKKKPITHSV